jgi:hypothetical protein
LGCPVPAVHHRRVRVERVSSPAIFIHGATVGSIPVCARAEVPGVKRSFATCGNLTRIFNESDRSAGSATINYNNYVYLRYVLLVNIVVALIPSMSVKGRANDPLLHSTWWTMDSIPRLWWVPLPRF